jgi:hypothetical protein
LRARRTASNLAVLDRRGHRSTGRLAHEDSVDRRSALEPRRRVDDVAGSHTLALARTGAERDERLASGDGNPNLQSSVLDDRIADRDCGPDGPLGVVLVRDGRAEERHHGVADELLDRAVVPLELAAQPGVARGERGAHVLVVELFRLRGEADEVGEEHSHDLPLFP